MNVREKSGEKETIKMVTYGGLIFGQLDYELA